MDAPKLLSVKKAAEMFGVDQSTVRRWIVTGVLEAVSLPHTGKREYRKIKTETVYKILKMVPVPTQDA